MAVDMIARAMAAQSINRELTEFGAGVLPDAGISQKGLVKLTSDVTMTDDGTAATPGFVHRRMNQLISKVQASVGVSNGSLTIALTNRDNPGLIVVSGRGTGGKLFSVAALCSYENKIISDVNANMYTSKEISISSGWNPTITYKCSQIQASDTFDISAKRL